VNEPVAGEVLSTGRAGAGERCWYWSGGAERVSAGGAGSLIGKVLGGELAALVWVV
jgi:hypothetical protein